MKSLAFAVRRVNIVAGFRMRGAVGEAVPGCQYSGSHSSVTCGFRITQHFEEYYWFRRRGMRPKRHQEVKYSGVFIC